MKRMCVLSGTMRNSGRREALHQRQARPFHHRQFLGPRAAIPPGHHQAGQHGRRPHLHHGADRDRHGEALHRPRAEAIQAGHGDQVGEVGVHDGAGGLGVAGLQRVDRRSPVLDFLADALVDQDVGVERGAERQHDAGDARQGQRRFQQRQPGDHQDDVEHQREVGEPAEQAVGEAHVEEDEDGAGRQREAAGADRIRAQFRPDGAFLDDGERRGQGAGAQQHRELIGRSAR